MRRSLFIGVVAIAMRCAWLRSVQPRRSDWVVRRLGFRLVPNPVQSLGDESLTDQKDSDAAVPAAAYHDVNADEPRRQRLPARRLRERRTARPATSRYSPTNTFALHARIRTSSSR